jgi:hypothetical protein
MLTSRSGTWEERGGREEEEEGGRRAEGGGRREEGGEKMEGEGKDEKTKISGIETSAATTTTTTTITTTTHQLESRLLVRCFRYLNCFVRPKSNSTIITCRDDPIILDIYFDVVNLTIVCQPTIWSSNLNLNEVTLPQQQLTYFRA